MALIDRLSGDLDDRRMSLGEHLEELRRHVWKSMIWIALALTVCLCFQSRLMKIAIWPHESCMEELKKEKLFAYTNAKLGQTAMIQKVIDELAAQDEVEQSARTLEREAAILKQKIAENPEALVDAVRTRRDALVKRQAALKAEQDALLEKPDPVKVGELEKKRLVLAQDTKTWLDDVKRDIAPFSEGIDAHIPQTHLIALKYTETFMSYLKVAMVMAIFVASPLVARELWGFVSAGLYKHEKKYVTFFAPVTFIVFIIGCAFGYYALIPAGLKFLANYGGDEITTDIQLSEYLSFFLNLTLMVGLIFELPLVMGFISLLGFITPEGYKKFRRYWFLVAFVLGAVIAPSPDPFNQSLCAIPLLILYEIGILLSRWIVGKRQRELVNPLPEGVAVAPMPSTPMPQYPAGAPGPK
jgi:Tat protein translocase TatC